MQKNPYKILGVDPGTNLLGYAVIEVNGKHLRAIDFGVIKLEKYKDHQTKLKEIYLQIQEIIETYLPVYMSIETPFYGKNVQSMLKLGRAQGVSMAAAITMGLEIYEYAPKKIKLAVTGNGNASKEQVYAMVERLLKIKIVKSYLDATDALAAALCHYYQGVHSFGGNKKFKDWAAYVKNNPQKKRTIKKI